MPQGDTIDVNKEQQQCFAREETQSTGSPNVRAGQPQDFASLYEMLKGDIQQSQKQSSLDNRKDLESFKAEILSSISEKYKVHEEKLNKLTDTVQSYSTKIAHVTKMCTDLEETNKFMSSEQETIQNKLKKFQEEIKSLKEETTKNKERDDLILKLSNKINEQECGELVTR